MREVEIFRQGMHPDYLGPIYHGALSQFLAAEHGLIRHGRIYDDRWQLNISGLYFSDITLPHIVTDRFDVLYPDGWDINTRLMLYTLRAPYSGQWHRDAPPYEDDMIVLLSIWGHDELEYAYQHPGRYYVADLHAGDIMLMPAATWHRGHCSTNRITYHCRVGPKGKVMPESPMDKLPPMTIRRFFGRTWRTLKYWLWLRCT